MPVENVGKVIAWLHHDMAQQVVKIYSGGIQNSHLGMRNAFR